MRNNGTVVSQRIVATSAGLSQRQRETAVRVATVPAADFDAAVEGDNPPTVTRLALGHETAVSVSAMFDRAARERLRPMRSAGHAQGGQEADRLVRELGAALTPAAAHERLAAVLSEREVAFRAIGAGDEDVAAWRWAFEKHFTARVDRAIERRAIVPTQSGAPTFIRAGSQASQGECTLPIVDRGRSRAPGG